MDRSDVVRVERTAPRRGGWIAAASPLLAATAACVLLLSACAGDGPVAEVSKDAFFQMAPPGVATKVVVARVEPARRGRLVAEDIVLDRIRMLETVYAVRRGSGRNEVWVLMDEYSSTDSIATTLGDDYRVTIVSTERPASP